MTIKRTYSCNLCRNEKPIDQLTRLTWTGRFLTGCWGQSVQTDTENHICKICLRSMYDIFIEQNKNRDRT